MKIIEGSSEKRYYLMCGPIPAYNFGIHKPDNGDIERAMLTLQDYEYPNDMIKELVLVECTEMYKISINEE